MTSCRSCASCERELSAVRLDLISALGQAQDLIAERDQYRDALEAAQGEAYLGALDGDDTPSPLAACRLVMNLCVAALSGERDG